MARPTIETMARRFESSWVNAYRLYEEYATEREAHYNARPDELPDTLTRVENDEWQDYRNWPKSNH